jgi:predicted Zn-dependent peptidase
MKIIRTTLPNKLRVILAPLHETQAVTVLVLFKVGSRYENPRNNGTAHFVEHLLFKGTTHRPTTLDITKELDRIGASFNAFTSKDHTGYYIKASAEHLELMIDILSDMYYNSLFDSKEIDRERHVIVEEINMYEDNPLMYAGDLIEQLIYGKGTHLGQLISGPRSVIKEISRENILKFKNQFYHTNNAVIALAGNIRHEHAMNVIRSSFHEARIRLRFPQIKKFQVKQQAPRVGLTYKATEQVQLALGFPAYGLEHRFLPALYMLSTILGGNMSSRLFINIRERLGLCYVIRSSVTAYEDTGNLVVQCGCDRQRVRLALEAILKEFQRARCEKVMDDECANAKEFLRGRMTLELEDSEHIADFFGKQALLEKKIRQPEQMLQRIQQVSTNDIQRVAKDLFRRARVNLVLIGPDKNDKPFFQILNKGLDS